MLEFKVIELSDKPWVEKLLQISDFRGCEYCFANNIIPSGKIIILINFKIVSRFLCSSVL